MWFFGKNQRSEMMSLRMKGISPLIASVMLIAITVAAAALIMGWFNGLTKSTTDTVSNRTTAAVTCSSAQITIEDVYVTAGTPINGSARVIIKNAGFDDLFVNSLQLYNKTGDNFSTDFAPSTLTSGNIRTVSLSNVSAASCPGDFSKVIVSTSCGGVSATFDGAPKCV